MNTQLKPILDWFARQGWQPLPFQQQTWSAYLAGRSGLVQVPTGAGKTYAAVMGPMAEMLATPGAGLQLLYLTPLRSLSRDIEQAIRRPIEAMGWGLRVESRTGDTATSRKAQQLKAMPDVLITTPESLSVMLSDRDSVRRFQALRCVVLDEWHELISSKRGTQAELSLSWLRQVQPGLRTWALSATLGNLTEAAQTAVGLETQPLIIQTDLRRETVIHSLLPPSVDSFPWAGHLGLKMLPALVQALDPETSTLLFTNTRNQAERWFQALQAALPEQRDRIALHHGSIDVSLRQTIEAGVKTGAIRWVVCTASLDLGVDFQPVERVVQIGSAKNLARLLQRAGRSAHVPAGRAEVVFVPTHALELLEMLAFRRGLQAGAIEARSPQLKPYDVLVQHLVTLACGEGFVADETLATVRKTVAYHHLTRAEFTWVLNFLEKGGTCLAAYPQYRKLVCDGGRYRIADDRLARMHRLGIGTITSQPMVRLVYTNRREIGTVEEGFVSRLKPGDVFFFAGRQLQCVQMKDLVMYVKNTRRQSTVTPTWTGGQLTLSDTLSAYLRQEVERLQQPVAAADPPERTCLEPIVTAQRRLSRIPAADDLLIECCRSREGQHLYVFPFESRFVHEGLGFLWAYRFARQHPTTFAISVNDYGFEILAPKGYPFQELFAPAFFSQVGLIADIKASLNLSELTQRQFRTVAQVAGLVFKGYPRSRKTAFQLQVSTSLLYDVFRKYEPDNLLLQQAEREVLHGRLQTQRLAKTLERLQSLKIVWQTPVRPSPLAFPLLVERLSSRLSNERLRDRIDRLIRQWEKS